MNLVLEETRTAGMHEEASERLERLICQYKKKEQVGQLIAEGCRVIEDYASTELQKRKGNEMRGLMKRVLTLKKPLGEDFCENVDEGSRELIRRLFLSEPLIGEMYSSLYIAVCDLIFSGYVASVRGQIESTSTFKERAESEAAERARTSYQRRCYRTPSLRGRVREIK